MILFASILLDPEPSVGLPINRYIEIHNNTEKLLTLNNWSIAVGENLTEVPLLNIKLSEYIL